MTPAEKAAIKWAIGMIRSEWEGSNGMMLDDDGKRKLATLERMVK